MALDPLGVIFTAKDLASANVTRLEGNFRRLDSTTAATAKNFSKNIGIMTAGLATIGAGALALAPLAVGVKQAANLEEVLLDVEKIAGAANVNIKSLGDSFTRMAPALGKNAVGLGRIAVAAAQLGIKGNESFEAFAASVARMSVALDVNESIAADTSAKLLQAFKLPINQVENLGSAFNELANNAAASSTEIVEATFRAASGAAQLGLSVDRVAAFSTALVETGQPALIAGTSIRRALEVAAGQTEKLAKVMGVSAQALQKSLGEDAAGTFQQVLEFFSKIENNAVRVGTATQVFGSEAAKAVSVLAGRLDRVNELVELSGKGFKEGTSLVTEFATVTRGFNFQLGRIGNALNSVMILIGTPLKNAITPVIKLFADWMDIVIKFLAPYKELVAQIIGFVGVTLLAVGSIITMKAAVALLTLALGPLSIFMGGLIILFAKAAAVLAVIAAGFFLVRKAFDANIGGIADFFADAFNKVQLFFKAMIGFLSKGEISDALFEQLQKAGLVEFVESTLRIFFALKRGVEEFFAGFMVGFEIFRPALDEIVKAIIEMGGVFGDLFKAVIPGFDKLMGDGATFKTIMGSIGAVVGAVAGALVTGVGGIIVVVTQVISLFVELFKAIANIGAAIVAFILEPGFKIGDAFAAVKETFDNLANSKVITLLANFGSGLGAGLRDLLGGNAQAFQPAVAGAPVEFAPVPVPAGTVGGFAPVQPGVTVPTAGLNNAAIQTQAQVAASQSTTNAVQEQTRDQRASGEGDVVLRNEMKINDKVLATSVNRVNKRKLLNQGEVQ